jgi:hypothetical protein
MTDTGTPAQWLIAEYEVTDLAGICLTDELDECERPVGGHVNVQPMFALKSVMDAGEPMRVTSSDYSDPGRRWL